MVKEQLHKAIIENYDSICKWYKNKTDGLSLPIYSSYDIRDAGYKVTNVDANIYPAGFNNICPTDKESAPNAFKKFIHGHYGDSVQRILLITEEHTNNAFYWQNVTTLKNLLAAVGFQTLIAIPKTLSAPLVVTNSIGETLEVHSADFNSDVIKKFNPQLIVSNNDFSEAYEEWSKTISLPMNPPRELGWYQRKKSSYFKFYNQLVKEFCEVAKVDPWLMQVETEVFDHFDMAEEQARKELAIRVDSMLERIQKKYNQLGIKDTPFVFVKNNAGTYGLAVIRVGGGQEVLDWNYKSRKKMKAAKGGRDVEQVIIQEGIPTVVKADDLTAEPVIYMVGCELVGGFLRTHQEKDATQSLNSPGAVYKRLCMSDLDVDPKKAQLENVYGWSAKLGLLAIAHEAKELGVTFKDYKPIPSVNCR